MTLTFNFPIFFSLHVVQPSSPHVLTLACAAYSFDPNFAVSLSAQCSLFCTSGLALPSQTLADWPTCDCLFLDNCFLMLVMVCGGSENPLLISDLSCLDNRSNFYFQAVFLIAVSTSYNDQDIDPGIVFKGFIWL